MHLRPGPELEKARREVAEYERFRGLVGQVTEVNEAICQARPAVPGEAAMMPLPGREGKRGLQDALAQEKAAELGRLATEAARVLGCGDAGMEAAEAVLRAGAAAAGRERAGAAAGRRPRAPWPSRPVRTARVSFMTYKGTTAERPAGGARAAAARPGSRERTAAARETGPGTTTVRRH